MNVVDADSGERSAITTRIRTGVVDLTSNDRVSGEIWEAKNGLMFWASKHTQLFILEQDLRNATLPKLKR
jgi:hypothetical protein